MTEDDLKLKITEVNELKKMDVVSFFQYLDAFNTRMEAKIKHNETITRHGRNKTRNKN